MKFYAFAHCYIVNLSVHCTDQIENAKTTIRLRRRLSRVCVFAFNACKIYLCPSFQYG